MVTRGRLSSPAALWCAPCHDAVERARAESDPVVTCDVCGLACDRLDAGTVRDIDHVLLSPLGATGMILTLTLCGDGRIEESEL